MMGTKQRDLFLICMIELLDYIFIACARVITLQTAAAAGTAHDTTFLMCTTPREILYKAD